MSKFRIAFIFMLSVLLGTVLVSIANTHVALQSLSAVGADFSTAVRLDAMKRDLIGFGPTLFAVVLIGFSIAFPVAGWIARLLGKPWRRIGFTLAGGAAVVCIMLAITLYYHQVMHSLITPVASSRTLAGLLSLALAGAGAGFFFSLLKGPAHRH
jgi:MFS family permease